MPRVGRLGSRGSKKWIGKLDEMPPPPPPVAEQTSGAARRRPRPLACNGTAEIIRGKLRLMRAATTTGRSSGLRQAPEAPRGAGLPGARRPTFQSTTQPRASRGRKLALVEDEFPRRETRARRLGRASDRLRRHRELDGRAARLSRRRKSGPGNAGRSSGFTGRRRQRAPQAACSSLSAEPNRRGRRSPLSSCRRAGAQPPIVVAQNRGGVGDALQSGQAPR